MERSDCSVSMSFLLFTQVEVEGSYQLSLRVEQALLSWASKVQAIKGSAKQNNGR